MWELCKYETNTAVIDDKGQRLTYGELIREIDELYLHVKERCLIFILCKNEIGSLLGYISALQNEIVPLLINAELENDSLKKLLDTYRPTYVWAPEITNPIISKYEKKYSTFGYTLYKTDYQSHYPLYPDLALLLTTSGSTGSPKFVRQSYSNITANTKSIIKYLKITASEKPITTLPMNYTYGLSIINTHIMAGATILLTEHSLMQKEFWNFFKEHEATSFGGVPYTYEILNRLRFDKMNLPSLRTITQAGGKLSKELQKKFTELAQSKNFDFIVMYGQCEATARMSYLPMKDSVTHYGSIGIAIPGGRFEVIDEKGIEITNPFTPGELVYLGPNVTLGYAVQGSDLIKGDERNGKLFTGDIAQFDGDGFYYIVGRMKRFLKVYGNRVNLDELEQIIKNRFVGIECAVSGIDDHIAIYITGNTDSNEIIQYISHKTGLNKISFTVKTINAIPKNDSGKTLYTELQ